VNPRQTLLELYATGLAAVHGEQAVYCALQATGKREPCHVIAIGKAAAVMFSGAQRYLRDAISSGLIITKYGHMTASVAPNVKIIESAHPIPDESSLQAGQALLDYLQQLPAGEPCLFLISGGTSSLVEVLGEGWTLTLLQEATRALLADASCIAEINAFRCDMSQIKGGKLWQFVGERPVSCLLISDVPSNDPAVIGSGLLFPAVAENFTWQIVASNLQMLEAMGENALVMPDFLEGNAETAAKACVEHLRNSDPGIYLWGAETTVALPSNPGQGGRNQHLALAAALELRPDDNILLLVAGTDGTDGMTDDAGALVDNGTIRRGNAENLDPLDCLRRADAGTFLAASGDLIHTGPTGTNVMDVIIGLKR
jgi:hydroxypyruvate reductase